MAQKLNIPQSTGLAETMSGAEADSEFFSAMIGKAATILGPKVLKIGGSLVKKFGSKALKFGGKVASKVGSDMAEQFTK